MNAMMSMSVVLALGSVTALPARAAAYVSAEGGFSVDLPADWDVLGGGSRVLAQTPLDRARVPTALSIAPAGSIPPGRRAGRDYAERLEVTLDALPGQPEPKPVTIKRVTRYVAGPAGLMEIVYEAPAALYESNVRHYRRLLASLRWKK